MKAHKPADAAAPALRLLLVSDLAGFTQTVQVLGDYRGLMYIREHNALLRDCLRLEMGSEIAHTGDGMIMAFANPTRALLCASRIQRALAERNAHSLEPPMRVRLGMHAGHPYAEENRLFGTCVNIAVRMCAAALPQQVLISRAAVDLVERDEHPLLERGEVALRGVLEPVQVYELVWQRSDRRKETLGSAA